jgi:PKD repeat protein
MKKLLFFLAFISFTQFSFAQCAPGFTWTQTAPNEITFTNTTSPITPDSTFFYWAFGDNTYDITQDPVHIFSDSGTFVVCLNISDSLLNCSASYCDTVTVTGSPICNMTVNAYSPHNASCMTCPDGAATVYMFAGTPPFTFLWSTGDTAHSIGGLLPGYVSVIVTDANGCTASDTIYIFVGSNPPCPTADFNSNHLQGDTVHFQDWSFADPQYFQVTWDFGDTTTGTGPTIDHHYNYPGTYTVCQTVSASIFQCSDTYCDTIVILPPPPPPGCGAYFWLAPQASSSAFIFTNYPDDSTYNFLWSWGDNTYDSILWPSHVYNVSGIYTICLTVTANFFTCSDTFCDVLTIQPGNTPFPVSVSQIPLGIESQEQNSFHIYPNPVNDKLVIKSDFITDNPQIIITDISGRIVYSGKLKDSELNCGFLESGIYLLQIESSSGWMTQRFIKQ